MIYYKTEEEIELVRKSSILVAKTHAEIAGLIKPGITTLALDKIAEEFIRDNGGIPAFKGYGGFIPGIKPGRSTAEYLDSVMSKITLPGSLFLGLVAILPAFAMAGGVNMQFAQFYGGTSLLILVGVILDTLQQIESHLLMRHYDGLMDSGRIKGKSSGSMM